MPFWCCCVIARSMPCRMSGWLRTNHPETDAARATLAKVTRSPAAAWSASTFRVWRRLVAAATWRACTSRVVRSSRVMWPDPQVFGGDEGHGPGLAQLPAGGLDGFAVGGGHAGQLVVQPGVDLIERGDLIVHVGDHPVGGVRAGGQLAVGPQFDQVLGDRRHEG